MATRQPFPLYHPLPRLDAGRLDPMTDTAPTPSAGVPKSLRRLTWFNALALPLCVAVLVVGLSVNSDFFMASAGAGWVVSRLLFACLLAIPATSIAALVLNRRAGWRPATWVGGLVLVLWAAWVGFLLLVRP
jgi:hypothetical protein